MDNLSFVTTAKIRGSYGTTGSNGIPDFVARPSLNPVNQAFGSSLIKGVYNGDPGNENLTWETSEKLDIGLDLSLVDNRVNVVFDYYDNKTSDLLLSKSLPTSSGYAGTLTNIGEMRNWGYELMLDANVIRKNDFSLTLGGNVTHNNQEVLSLGGAQELFNFFGALRTVVGGELQQIRGVKAIGVVKPGEVIPAQPNVVAGDIKFEDFDNNGAIGDFLSDDGQLVGDPNLDWIYGFNATLRFKNFELFALLQGQAGGYVYDFYLIQVGTDAQGVNLSKEFWYDGRYVSESQQGNGTTPRAGALLTGNAGVGFVSSLGAQKTDYLRIRNITLSYNIPASLSEKISVRGARIFTSVENLVTFTDFIGGNPDARRNSIGGPGLIGGSRLGGTYDGRELGLTSVPSLPLPRTWTFGLNFSF
jgi:TonB-dependent starch-binding outer membrane protein SusC